MKKIILLNSILFCCLIISYAQPGRPDTSFGNNGIVKTSLSPTVTHNSQGIQILPLPDGNYYILIRDESQKTYVAKRLSNGSADKSYGNNGFSVPVNIYPHNAVLQTDGKIVVAGSLTSTIPNDFNTDFGIVRFNTNGSLDNSFSDDGIQNTDFGANDYAFAVGIQNDGKIVAAGQTSFDQNVDFALARYNSDGSPDNTFDSDGKLTTDFSSLEVNNDFANSLAIQSDGKIVVAGSTSTSSNYDFAIARFNSDGSLDNTFDGDGKQIADFTSEDAGNSVAIQKNGKIVIAGYTAVLFHDDYDFAVACFNSDGSPDSTFNHNGKATADFDSAYDRGYSLVIQSDNKILVAGEAHSTGNITSDFGMVRFNSDGTTDTTFDADGKQMTYFGGGALAQSAAIQSDGKIILAGSVYTDSINFGLARYHPNGSPDNNFDGDGILTDKVSIPQGSTSFSCTAVQNDGKIIAGGYSWNGSHYVFAIARFNPDGTFDNSFSSDGKQGSGFGIGTSVAVQNDGKIVLGGSVIDSITGNVDFGIIRYKSNGDMDSTFGINGITTTDFGDHDEIYSIAIQSDGDIIAAGYATIDYGFRKSAVIAVVHYNPNGGTIFTFINVDSPAYNGQVGLSTAIQEDGKIIVAGYITVPTENPIAGEPTYNSKMACLRLNIDGTPDYTFSNFVSPLSYEYASAVAIQNDGKIILGGTNFFTPAFIIARLNTDGSLDNSFNENGRVSTAFDSVAKASIALQADGKIVVAGGTKDLTLARYNNNGTLDNIFGTNGIVITDAGGYERIEGIAISGNKLYTAGTDVTNPTIQLGVVAAYLLDNAQPLPACPLSQIVTADKDKCSAVVNDIDPVLEDTTTQVNYTLSGATTGSGTGSASGKIFNKGVTTVTYSLANDSANNCSFTVTVNDTIAPRITPVFALPNILWPANNTMRYVYLLYYSRDNCGTADCKISITANQDITGDWEIINDYLIKLRAENTDGKPRIYTVTVTCTDASGNTSSRSVNVRVPNFGGRNIYSNGDANRPENIIDDFNLKVFPNPTKDHFNLLLPGNSNEKISVKVYDISGRLMETKTGLTTGNNIMLGATLKQGTYIAEVHQGMNVHRLKLIKTR